MNNYNFEKLLKIRQSESLTQSFNDMIEQYNKVCGLITNYFSSGVYSGRMTESEKDRSRQLEESQNLSSTIRKEIDNLKYNIQLVKSKINKGFFSDIDWQRDQLKNLLYNILSANNAFHRQKDNSLNHIQQEMINFEIELKQLIETYNIKARKNHRPVLINFEEELKLIKQEFINNLSESLKDF